MENFRSVMDQRPKTDLRVIVIMIQRAIDTVN